jgi:hypothetical protein
MKPNRLVIAILLLLMASQPVLGQRDGDDRGKGRGREGITAGEAAERVRKDTGGRVLSVEDGGNGYRVRVLTPKGEVRVVSVPRGR